MMSLNFQAPKHEKLLMARKKNCTVRLGDVRKQYPESSIVWITTGKKYEVKKKLYTAFIDFEEIYKRRITMDDIVTVIYFSEVL